MYRLNYSNFIDESLTNAIFVFDDELLEIFLGEIVKILHQRLVQTLRTIWND